MKTLIMPFRPAAALLALFAAGTATATAATPSGNDLTTAAVPVATFAEKKEAVVAAAPKLTISVSTLRDLGGASYKGPDGKPLTERLASALRKYLSDGAEGRYTVGGIAGAAEAPKTAPKFVVEGDISAIEVGDADKRPYLLITRVFREDGKARRLVAQYAGSAQSLRDLTGNMTNQAGVSRMGLAGQMAKEIANAALAARGGTEEFDALVKAATTVRRVTVDVLSEASGDQKPRQQLVSGEKYRLRVNSQDAGSVYIVAVAADGRPMTPYAQSEPLDVAQGAPVVLPPNSPFTAPKVNAPTTVEYIILVRKKKSTASSQMPSFDTRNMVASAAPIAPLFPRGAVRGGQETTSTAIELLTSTSPLVNKTDDGVENLVELSKTDGDSGWVGARVKITVVPVGGSGGTPGV